MLKRKTPGYPGGLSPAAESLGAEAAPLRQSSLRPRCGICPCAHAAPSPPCVVWATRTARCRKSQPRQNAGATLGGGACCGWLGSQRPFRTADSSRGEGASGPVLWLEPHNHCLAWPVVASLCRGPKPHAEEMTEVTTSGAGGPPRAAADLVQVEHCAGWGLCSAGSSSPAGHRAEWPLWEQPAQGSLDPGPPAPSCCRVSGASGP